MSKELEVVAWVRLNLVFDKPSTIHLCDSDHPAAFAVCFHSKAMSRIRELEAKLSEYEKLSDPVVLHANLLRGYPAQLSRSQYLHLAGADQLEAENAELKERNAERDDALRYRGFEDSIQGIHEVIAAESFEAPDEWYGKPFCRIQFHCDNGDSSVGIPGYMGWELSKDQSGTVIADLVAIDTAMQKEKP